MADYSITAFADELTKVAGVGSKLRIARSVALKEKRQLEQVEKDKVRKTWMKMVRPAIDKGFKRVRSAAQAAVDARPPAQTLMRSPSPGEYGHHGVGLYQLQLNKRLVK